MLPKDSSEQTNVRPQDKFTNSFSPCIEWVRSIGSDRLKESDNDRRRDLRSRIEQIRRFESAESFMVNAVEHCCSDLPLGFPVAMNAEVDSLPILVV